MYLYFDRNGTLKEYVNDDALRQGNDGINKMYIYVDRNDLHGVDARFTLPDGTIIQAPNEYTTFVNKEIPFDAKRDLRYFKYYTGYKFLVIDLASEDFGDVNPLSYGGLVHASLNFILLGSLPPLLQLGDINFNVEVSADGGNVLPQEYLNLSDYQYLRRIIADVEVNKADIINIADFDSLTTVEDLWNRLYDPADGEYIKVNFVDFKGFYIDDKPLYTTFVRMLKNNDYYEVDIIEPDGLYHHDNVYKDTKLQEFTTFTAFADKITNPMTSGGDLIYGGTNGTPQRLPKGRSKQVLAMNQWGNAPEWQDFAGSVIEVAFSGDTTIGELLAVMPAKVNNFTTAQINFETIVINNVAYELGICNVIVYGNDNNVIIGGAKFTLYNETALETTDTLSALTVINNTKTMTNPMVSASDMIVGGANGIPERLQGGTANQVLKMNADGTAIQWGNVSNESIIVDGTALLSSNTVNDLLALMTLSDGVYSALVEFGALSIKNGTYPLGLCNVVIKYLVSPDAYQVAIQGPRYTLYSDGIEGTDTLSNLKMVNNPEIIDARSLNDTHLTITVGNIINLITQQLTAQWTNGMLTALIDFGTLTINGVNYDFGISNVIIKDADDTQYLVYINSNDYYLYSETRKSISATLEDLTLLNNRIVDGTNLSSTDYLEDLEALLQPKKDNLRIGLVNLGEMDFDGVHYSLGLCNVMFNYRSHTGTTADVVIQGAKYLLYGNSLDTTAKAFTDLKVRLLANIAERVDDTMATESTTINHIIDELPEWDDNCKCGFIDFGTIVIDSTTYNIGLCNVMITAGYNVDIVGTKWRLTGTGLNGTDTIADLTISSTVSTGGGGGASYIDGTALSGTVTPTQLIALMDTDADGVAFGMVDFGVFTLASVDYDFGLCNVMVKSTSSTEANLIISNGRYVVYGNGIEKNVSINYQVQLIDTADRVLVDFFDDTNSAFNSALSSADYGKLTNSQIIYDYTLSSNRNPLYLYKTENKSATGSGYTFIGTYINKEITVNFGPAPAYAITVRQTNPMSAQGDIIVGGNNGYANRLAKGSQGQILTMGVNSPQWADKYIDGTSLTGNSTFQNVFDLLGSESSNRTNIVKFGSLNINGHSYYLGIGIVQAWPYATPNCRLRIITSQYMLYGTSTSTSTTLSNLTVIDLNDALINPITNAGDLIVGDSSGNPVRLAKGSTGQVLKAGSNGLAWANEGTGMTNPMNSVGDIIVGGNSGAPRRLPIGSVGKVLTSDGSDVYWGTASGGSASEIVVVSQLPTADANSPSFIQYNSHLYRKKTIVPNVATINDLSGTSWYFDEMIDLFSNETYDFNFNSGGNTCIGMRVGSTANANLFYIRSAVSSFNVYNPSTDLWEDEAYRTIEISGGTDATNSDLIAWIKNSATLIGATTNTYVYELVGDIFLESSLPTATAETPMFIQYNGSFYRKKTNVSYATASDLTSLRNTNWLIDLEPEYLTSAVLFNLNFTSNNTDYKYLMFNNYKLQYSTGGSQRTTTCEWDYNGVTSYDPVWVDNAYRTINITGGTSTDDSDLLDWFKANATWLNPTPTYTYEYVKVCDELDATSFTTATTIAQLIALLPPMNNGLTSAMVDFGVFNSTAMGLCQVVVYETATDTYSVAIKGAMNDLTGTGLAPTDTLADLT